MKKQIIAVFIAASAATAHAQTFGSTVGFEKNPTMTIGTPAAADAVTLQQYLEQSKDLQGSFTQTIHSRNGQEVSSGTFKISKPGKFFWDYQSPDKQQIVSNGKKVWQYDIDLEQIAVRNSDELVGDALVQLLSGKTSLDSEFTITAVNTAQAPIALQKYAGEVYRLTPKKNQEDYDSAYAVMKNGVLAAIAIDTGSGQQTVIALKNIKRNTGIPTSVFEFTPPKGVDVIGD